MRRQAKALFICVALFTFFASAASALADAPPTVTIDAPTEVKYQTAHVSGTVNPEGGPSTTYWRFEYSSEPSNPYSWAWSSVFGQISGAEATGTAPIPVEGTLTSLTPGTEYAVRLFAENGEWPNYNRVESPLPNPTFTTLAVAPPTVTLAGPSAVTAHTAHFEADIDPGGNDPAFNTSWFFSCTPACPGLEGTIPGDGASHHISVDASGLEAGTLHEVTLYASNVGGTGSGGPEAFTTGTEPPTIKKVFAHALTTEAELGAEINPNGLETSYHFEYGSTSAYGHSTAVKTLPAGSVAKVTANIGGLTPGATYHYRLIVENADGSAESGDRSFTERSDAGDSLPNGRAYELVSNEDTNLGDVIHAMSSDSGSRVEYATHGGMESSNSVFLQTVSAATRSAEGWTSVSLEPPSPQVASGLVRLGGQLVAVSADLKKSLAFTFAGIDPADQNEGFDLYLFDSETQEATWITKPDPVYAAHSFPTFVGASADLRHIYFHIDTDQLLPGAPGNSIYEWTNGHIKVASIFPDGTSPGGTGRVIDPSTLSPYQNQEFSPTPPVPHEGTHPVSLDGSTFYFKGDTSIGPGYLYARRNGETFPVSFSQRSGSEGDSCLSTFLGASSDGDLAYFECSNQLTNAATEGGGIYSYRLSSGDLTLLTPDAGRASGLEISSGMVSDDASHVYFISTAALAPAATEGDPNLYVYSGGQTHFIASVPSGTKVERTSRSGRFALLESTGAIGGADPAGHMAIYRYDDATQEIACVSCRPDGSPSEGDASLADRVPELLAAPPYKPRGITDGGDVFFTSSDQLVPTDVTQAWDVYEYTEGAPHLLSSGRSGYDSYLGDNSDSGSDVFFITRAALLPGDQDGGTADLYDARVGGGFPEAGPAPAECVEDACQGGVSQAPKPVGAGSRGFRPSAGHHPLRGKLRWVRQRVKKGSVLLTVRVSGPGRLIVMGHGVQRKSRYLKKAGTYQLRTSLTSWARSSLERKGHLVVQLVVIAHSRDGSLSKRKINVRFED